MTNWKEKYGDYRYRKFEDMKLKTVTPRYYRKFYKREGIEFYKRILKNSLKMFVLFFIVAIVYTSFTLSFMETMKELKMMLTTKEIMIIILFYLSMVYVAFVYEYILKKLAKKNTPRVLNSANWKKPIISYLIGRGLFYRRSYDVQTRTKQKKVMYDELKMLGLKFEQQVMLNETTHRITYTTTLTNAVFQEKEIIKTLEKLFSNK